MPGSLWGAAKRGQAGHKRPLLKCDALRSRSRKESTLHLHYDASLAGSASCQVVLAVARRQPASSCTSRHAEVAGARHYVHEPPGKRVHRSVSGDRKEAKCSATRKDFLVRRV